LGSGSRAWPAIDVARLDDGAADGADSGPDGGADLDVRLQLALDDLGATAIEATTAGWTVYFDEPAVRDAALSALRDALGDVVVLAPREVPDEGWAVKVQASLGAIQAGRVTIAPPWDVPAAAGDETIVIEPSVGFGTGHHQSTRLCLCLLQELSLEGRSVLDVGTGSGVLALAAARLGAATVLGIDNDADAIAAARENVARNATTVPVALEVSDLARDTLAPADLVLANLTAWVIRAHADALRSLVRPGGTLVASGFTTDQVPLVTESLAPLRVAQRLDEDDWVGLAFTR
jgi:ribosomal protein L11 methyltransferase